MWNGRNSPGASAGMRGMSPSASYRLSSATPPRGGDSRGPPCPHGWLPTFPLPNPFILLLLLLGKFPSAVPGSGLREPLCVPRRDIPGGTARGYFGGPPSRAGGSEGHHFMVGAAGKQEQNTGDKCEPGFVTAALTLSHGDTGRGTALAPPCRTWALRGALGVRQTSPKEGTEGHPAVPPPRACPWVSPASCPL